MNVIFRSHEHVSNSTNFCHNISICKVNFTLSYGVAELANASIVHPRDPCSNPGVGKIFSDSVCIGFEFKPVGC